MNVLKLFIPLLVTLLFSVNTFAVTYTKSSSGNYSNAAGWSPSYPGTTISAGDVVIIDAAVTMDKDLTVSGTLTINSGKSLTGTKTISEVKSGGTLNVNGDLDIKKIDKIKGTANFNGNVEVTDDMKIEDNGQVTIGSSGTFDGKKIEVKDDGVLTINNFIELSSELKVKDDAIVNFENGSTSAIEDVKIEDDAVFNAKAGSDVTIENDLEVKDDGQLNVDGTLTVEDDIEFKDDATINITGVLNLCDDNGDEGDNDFDVDEDVTFVGDGTFCMCSSNNDNNYNNDGDFNSSSITFNTNCNGPLPIELIRFDAVLVSKDVVEINWSTAMEINNAFFSIEYSLDGENWMLVEEVSGAGTVNVMQHYVVQHNISNLLSEVIFYRIKNTDFEGRFAYSDLVTVEVDENGGLSADYGSKTLVYPSPANKGEPISLKLIDSAELKAVHFVDFLGKSVEVEFTLTSNNVVSIQPRFVSTGIHILVLSYDFGTEYHSVVINK